MDTDNAVDQPVNTAAMLAAAAAGDYIVVEALLSEDMSLFCVDENGRTALHHASQAGHADIVALLQDYGADVDTRDTEVRLTFISAALLQSFP
jgi:ankyrin repeat protein